MDTEDKSIPIIGKTPTITVGYRTPSVEFSAVLKADEHGKPKVYVRQDMDLFSVLKDIASLFEKQ